jgi:polysaccharide chain length determinant protein (PEP-CTERM system associated)
MSDVRYYLSLFVRRLPAFLLVAAVVSAVFTVVAISLPPAYVSRMTLIIEAPQIPDELAPSTVRTPGPQRLQIIEQRLLTRPLLLDIATRLDVLKDQKDMNPDEIVQAMRARTKITKSSRTTEASIMTVSFEARTPQLAAQVLNEYLSQIQRDDSEYRRGRAGQTFDFFQQEVQRLSVDLQRVSGQILEFKNANSDALPDNLDFRQKQRAEFQDRLEQTGREIFTLKSQRDQLVAIFSQTGRIGSGNAVAQTPAEKNLAEGQAELENAKLIYSETNPRVKMLQARVEQLQSAVEAERGKAPAEVEDQTGNSALDFQLAGIDTRVSVLENQRETLEKDIAVLTDTITRTPANAIALGELEREYENTQTQYNAAVENLSQASTGERIELLSRGERISVIEQPAVPSEPTKPNRLLIAGGGTFLGILLGIGLVLLMVLLNSAPRRPEDLIRKLDVWPIATLPHVRTRRELVIQRGFKLLLIAIILVGVPVAVWSLHTFYQPLDLIADRIMNKLGVRW